MTDFTEFNAGKWGFVRLLAFWVLRRLRCIDGWAYAACSFREVYKRVTVGEWVPVLNGFPTFTLQEIEKGRFGFRDIHGPDESNIYVVGGHGDVWRYDGSIWRQCDFPSNDLAMTKASRRFSQRSFRAK